MKLRFSIALFTLLLAGCSASRLHTVPERSGKYMGCGGRVELILREDGSCRMFYDGYRDGTWKIRDNVLHLEFVKYPEPDLISALTSYVHIEELTIDIDRRDKLEFYDPRKIDCGGHIILKRMKCSQRTGYINE